MEPLPQRLFAAQCLKHSLSDYSLLDISQFKPTLRRGVTHFQQLGDTTCKVHPDSYDQTPMITKKGPSDFNANKNNYPARLCATCPVLSASLGRRHHAL
jgi:hypothetical protein